MGDGKFTFFVMQVILLVVFLGTIITIFKLSGIGFLLELLLLLLLIVISFLSAIPAYSNANSGWGFLAAANFLLLANMFIINLRVGLNNKTVLITTLFAGIGFLLAIMKIKSRPMAPKESEAPYEKEAKQDAKAGVKAETARVRTEFSPGKYVASSTGTVFHKASCDWAKKIQKRKQVWFNSEEDARKQYKPHSCLRE